MGNLDVFSYKRGKPTFILDGFPASYDWFNDVGANLPHKLQSHLGVFYYDTVISGSIQRIKKVVVGSSGGISTLVSNDGGTALFGGFCVFDYDDVLFGSDKDLFHFDGVSSSVLFSEAARSFQDVAHIDKSLICALSANSSSDANGYRVWFSSNGGSSFSASVSDNGRKDFARVDASSSGDGFFWILR